MPTRQSEELKFYLLILYAGDVPYLRICPVHAASTEKVMFGIGVFGNIPLKTKKTSNIYGLIPVFTRGFQKMRILLIGAALVMADSPKYQILPKLPDRCMNKDSLLHNFWWAVPTLRIFNCPICA